LLSRKIYIFYKKSLISVYFPTVSPRAASPLRIFALICDKFQDQTRLRVIAEQENIHFLQVITDFCILFKYSNNSAQKKHTFGMLLNYYSINSNTISNASSPGSMTISGITPCSSIDRPCESIIYPTSIRYTIPVFGKEM